MISSSAVGIRSAMTQELLGDFLAFDNGGSSFVSLQNVIARDSGGGFFAIGEVEIAGNSTINMSNSRAESGDGGGFDTEKGLKLLTGSRLNIRNATAGNHGGGFHVKGRTLISRSTVSIEKATARQFGGGFNSLDKVVIDEMSSVSISNSGSAEAQGGGFNTDRRLQVTNSSVVSLQNVTAQKHGGGFKCLAEAEIAGNSTVNISNSCAESRNGGGFYVERDLEMSTGSRLIIRNATAGKHGGGFFAEGRTLISHSTVSIQNAMAWHFGGGFFAGGFAFVNASTVTFSSTHAGADGGAFSVVGLILNKGSMSTSNSTALRLGSAGRVHGQVLISSQSNLVVKHAQGLHNSSVLAASCLRLRDRSQVLFEGVVGGHGVELQNSGCSDVCSNSTFHVAADSALNASGRLSSGLLSLAACPQEEIRLSGIHLHSWSSTLLSTRPSFVVVDQVSVDYEPAVNNLQVLAAKDALESISVRRCHCIHASRRLTASSHTSSLCPCASTVQPQVCLYW